MRNNYFLASIVLLVIISINCKTKQKHTSVSRSATKCVPLKELPEQKSEPTQTLSEEKTPTATSKEQKPSSVSRNILCGNWQRQDGSYSIIIKKIMDNGNVEASYFNPNPIHVSGCQIHEEDNSIGIFMKLEDRGYPGCTYTLNYNSEYDVLYGIYFQALQNRKYNVEFIRIPPQPASSSQ